MDFGAETWTMLGTTLGIGVALAALILSSIARLDADRRHSDAKMDAFRAEAAADRRALQDAMDAFRAEMQRLAERQSRVEGALETSRNTAAAD